MTIAKAKMYDGIYYPRVEPIINSACELMISAIKSSLYASFGFRHFRPPGNTTGRSCGVLGQLFCFCTRLAMPWTMRRCFSSIETFFCVCAHNPKRSNNRFNKPFPKCQLKSNANLVAAPILLLHLENSFRFHFYNLFLRFTCNFVI